MAGQGTKQSRCLSGTASVPPTGRAAPLRNGARVTGRGPRRPAHRPNTDGRGIRTQADNAFVYVLRYQFFAPIDKKIKNNRLLTLSDVYALLYTYICTQHRRWKPRVRPCRCRRLPRSPGTGRTPPPPPPRTCAVGRCPV